MTDAEPDAAPPQWPYCGRGTSASDSVGCRGVRAENRSACLAHLDDAERAAYLAALAPGADLDLRAVSVTEQLLTELLDALRDPADGISVVGQALCNGAIFTGGVNFRQVRFRAAANFSRGKFEGETTFRGASFDSHSYFNEALFAGLATFSGANFGGDLQLVDARFDGKANFITTEFAGDVLSHGAVFASELDFGSAAFRGTQRLGPLTCLERVSLFRANFSLQATLVISAAEISCKRARFEGPITLGVRHARVDLSEAEFVQPFTVRTERYQRDGLQLQEIMTARHEPMAKIMSLSGIDAAKLLLSDVDMSECRFTGAHHLDQLRREGRWEFASPPAGLYWRSGLPLWWSHRTVIAEECAWRALPSRPAAARRGWSAPPGGEPPGLATLTSIYRQLRKNLEDCKDEPGAADFYYGEMEMRRHSATIPHGERLLLHLYWALSGYGMRASRAVVWFAATVAVTVVLIMVNGLPNSTPRPIVTETTTPAGRIELRVENPDPVLTLPMGRRFSVERLDKSLRIVLNSAIFRSSGQNLTAWGTYTEMISRVVEPVLLGLAVLAVRGRLKRS
ncbi:hypothetical protein ABZ252_25785 [Streptomyces sp. NPDC006175]|uniref:pentapeptide repeat-containing protein n=1 Tax=Streptomyces sp. NPDC006175 TaxID=3154471 RepID=UPI0033A77D42